MFLSERAAKVLVPALITCGGVAGPLFASARAIQAHGQGELTEILPSEVHPFSKPAVEKLIRDLTAGVKGGKISPEVVMRRFGLPKHFQEMKWEADQELPSVAREIPPQFRAVAHTLLPLRADGAYANEGRIISFKGLVPLGSQDGVLVVHLSGVFSCRCSKKAVEALLAEQAQDPQFLAMADQVKELDYEGTQLQRVTKMAKAELGL